jgi:hypothetical protein
MSLAKGPVQFPQVLLEQLAVPLADALGKELIIESEAKAYIHVCNIEHNPTSGTQS